MDESQGKRGRRHTILLVDDEPLNIRILSQILRDRYRIIVATGGGEALKCATSSHPPDLILLDMVMPDIDGIAVCQELANSPETRDIPVIMVSGRASDSDISRALQAGAADCMGKPVHPDLLRKRIAFLLSLKQHERRSSSNQDIVIAALEQEKEANIALKSALRRMEQELDASRRYRHMFLAEMHHEIKTHLTTITGMTGLALRKELTAELYDYITTIERATSTLVELVNDIVDLSMLEEGEIEAEYREFAPAQLINEICDACGELAIKKGAELVVDTSPDLPAVLKGSPTRIRQLITHLVHYTIKWLKGKEILLTCKSRINGNRCILEVSVTCIDNTLTENEAQRLLEYAGQVERSDTGFPASAGLGLPICRRILEKISGRLDVSTDSKEGITFTCVIPAECINAAAPDAISLSERLGRGIKALVIDDSRLAAKTVSVMLQRAGIAVDAAHDWVIPLEQMKEASKGDAEEGSGPWDIILLDWSMPGSDGMEITRRIRAAGLNTPIIIMGAPALLMMRLCHEKSCHKAERPSENSDDMHNTGFIMKPVKQEPLLEKMEEMLSAHMNGENRESQHESVPSSRLEGIHALLVEDNAINRQIARQLLEMAGIVVTGVSNGASAVDAASSARFDVILMDIELPDMNGMEAAERIRRGPTNAETPVIALTAHSWTSHRKAYRKAGMEFCIEKPIDIDELYHIIEKAIAVG